MTDSALYQIINDLQGLAGAASEAQDFVIRAEGGVAVSVSCQWGSSSSVVLRAPYGAVSVAPGTAPSGYRGWEAAPRAPRPLDITVRRETTVDVAAKAKGVNREVQTGDAEFDAEVYVDSTAPDAVVAFVLSRDEARRAIRTLVVDEGFLKVVIDDAKGNIEAWLHTFEDRTPRAGRGARVFDAFATLVRNVPRVDSSGRRRTSAATIAVSALSLAAFVGTVVCLEYAFHIAPEGCVGHDSDGEGLTCHVVKGHNCCEPMAVGCAGGIPLGLLVGWAVSRSFRGRSNSSSQRSVALFATAIIVLEIVTAVVARLMW
jgi:hypothetical protein